jgi:hypothetical protein
MTITGYKDFVETLAAVSVTGVRTQLVAPPQSVGASDLPVSFVQLPSGAEGPTTFQTHGMWPTLRADLVVLYLPVSHNQQQPNYADTLELMDNVSTALRGIAPNALSRGPLSWDIRLINVDVGGAVYWAVVASVEGHG